MALDYESTKKVINVSMNKTLGRDATQEEINMLFHLPEAELARILDSGEKIANFYQQYLGRMPDEEGLKYWIEQSKTLGISGVEQQIKNTPEALQITFQPKTIKNPSVNIPKTLNEILGESNKEPNQPTVYNKDLPFEVQLRTGQLMQSGLSGDNALNIARKEYDDLQTQIAAETTTKAAQEKQIADLIAGYPTSSATARAGLASELTKYSGTLYGDLQKQAEASLGSRGLLESGALNVAIADSMKKLAAAQEATLAPMAREDYQAGTQLAYENALRLAQGAGTTGENLSAYGRSLTGEATSGLYQSGQTAIQQAFNEAMSKLAFGQNLGLNAQQQGYNVINQNQDYQNQLRLQQQGYDYNQEMYNKQLSNSLWGQGANTLLGALIGGLTPIGWGAGALMGLTGQYFDPMSNSQTTSPFQTTSPYTGYLSPTYQYNTTPKPYTSEYNDYINKKYGLG